jgi:hypothetical protein
VREPWPSISDILQGLAGRLEQNVGELGQGAGSLSANDNGEKRLALEVRDLIAMGDSKPHNDALDGFLVRLRHLLATLHDRDEQRAAALGEAALREDADRQEQLLEAARALTKQGDLERASKRYQELLDRDTKGMLAKALAPEIQALEQHRAALSLARQLAKAGHHVQAIAELKKVCPSPWEHLLPWRVESTPSGARARFTDGTVRVTPCTVETAPEERVDFTLELPGFESMPVHSDGPGDQAIVLSRLPQRWWRAQGKVEAPPVAVQDEHVLVDRQGGIVRMGAGGALRWQVSLESLSGIARAPVFLPGHPGALLTLTEDGNAWVVDCADGHLEGPWDVGSPPIAGPYVLGGDVRARFSSGRECRWDARLKPEITDLAKDATIELTAAEHDATRGSDAGMSLLRRRDSGLGATHDSPWSPWTVEVRAETYFVHERTEGGHSFFVRRQGEWSYLAWEAPDVRAPVGRLWVSDGAGLRAFEP